MQRRSSAARVWGGDAGAWFAPVFIRRHRDERLPHAPPALRPCLDPLAVGQRP